MRDHVDPAPEAATPSAKGRIAAVVVTYNRKGQLRRTVARLLEEGVDHLVVVDNASTDGTREWLATLDDPRLHPIRCRRNQGGAGGFERGLRAARAQFDPDWYVVMDDDARPHPGAIDRFRRLVAERARAQAAGPAAGLEQAAAARAAGHPESARPRPWEALAGGVYYPDGEICEMNRPSRNPFWCRRSFLRTLFSGRAGFHVADHDYGAQSPLPIDAASFVGLFLSRGAIERVGYPEGELFIYGDDVLYTLGLTRAGGRIGFAPWLAFEHDCTTFRRGEGQIHRPLWKVYYNYRNGLFAYRTAAGPVLFWLVMLVTVPKWALKVRAYENGERMTYLRLLWLAISDALWDRRRRAHRHIRALARHGQMRAARRAQARGRPVMTPGE